MFAVFATLAVPLLVILLTEWLMPAMVPETLPFGVRVPADQIHHRAVLLVRRHYYVQLFWITVTVSIALIVITWAGIAFTALSLILTFLTLVAGYLNY